MKASDLFANVADDDLTDISVRLMVGGAIVIPFEEASRLTKVDGAEITVTMTTHLTKVGANRKHQGEIALKVAKDTFAITSIVAPPPPPPPDPTLDDAAAEGGAEAKPDGAFPLTAVGDPGED